MPIFDFHVHPGMKAHLGPATDQADPWLFVHVQAKILDTIVVSISKMFDDALDSQASLHQLWAGGVNLFGLIVYSLESEVAKQLLKKGPIKNGNVFQLDPKRLEKSATNAKYFEIAMEEIKLLKDRAKAPDSLMTPPGTQLKFLKSFSEYNRNDANTLHAVLILEGSQNLFNSPDSATAKEDFFTNLDLLNQEVRLFAMNVCHFQQQPIANHAFAMLFLDRKPFVPTGNGITEWGKEAILKLYAKGILIDTKHMSWQSRKDLYQLRKENNISLPLLCSHTGVTGISEKYRYDYMAIEPARRNGAFEVKFLKKRGILTETAYNMASLQLYDEDIVEIIKSGGIIGISMDQRIIGFPIDELEEDLPPVDIDYISLAESERFFETKRPTLMPYRGEDPQSVLTPDDLIRLNGVGTTFRHPKYFLNQIVHILRVCKSSSALTVQDGMKAICIGSDYDGLVNPLDNCSSAAKFPKFRQELEKLMNQPKFWNSTGLKNENIDPKQLLDNIFFNNGESYIRKNFR